MIEANVDLWLEPADAKCITTNGFVKKNGEAVMGAGVAHQAQQRFAHFPETLGWALQNWGNKVIILDEIGGVAYIAFPVKYNWGEKANLELIKKSAEQLMRIIHGRSWNGGNPWNKVLLPRPGCKNGRLLWKDVKPILEPILDDRVWVITNDERF